MKRRKRMRSDPNGKMHVGNANDYDESGSDPDALASNVDNRSHMYFPFSHLDEDFENPIPDYFSNLSLEIMCRILDYLPIIDAIQLECQCRRLQQAVTMHLRMQKAFDFTESKVYGYMPKKITDNCLINLLKRCPELLYIHGFYPETISKRRQRGSESLTIPGVIMALTFVPKLIGIEICDIFLLQSILTYFPKIEILKMFRNRSGQFPIVPTNTLTLSSAAKVSNIHLSGVVLPQLPVLQHVRYLYLRWVHFTHTHPFKDFSAPLLHTFVMSNCAGPSNALKYVPLITGLAASKSLSRLELIRVPFLGGLIQHIVEDSWRVQGLRQLETVILGACKHVLEVDLGFLAITSASRVQRLCIQPSLTKDSLFSALHMCDAHFPVFHSLSLGYVDPFPEQGKWTSAQLLSEGLSDVIESPGMITDIGMRAVGRCFGNMRRMEIYNCPHLHYPSTWITPAGTWSKLLHLQLRRCHAIRLDDFCRFISMLPELKTLQLEYMFCEPPKGCMRVGLSSGTGMGVSSALVQNNRHDAPIQNINNNNAPMAAANQDGANNNIHAVANLNVGNNNAARAVANRDGDNNNVQAAANQNAGNNNVAVGSANQNAGNNNVAVASANQQAESSDEDVYMDEHSDDSYLQKKGNSKRLENKEEFSQVSESGHIEGTIRADDSLPSTSGTPSSRIDAASSDVKVTCTCACHLQASETSENIQDVNPNSTLADATTSQKVEDSSQSDHCSESIDYGSSVVAKARNDCSESNRLPSNEIRRQRGEPMEANESSRLDVADIPVKVASSPMPRRPSTIERQRNPSGHSCIIPSPGTLNVHSPTDDYDVYLGFGSAKDRDSTGSIASRQGALPVDSKKTDEPVASSSHADSTLCSHSQARQSVKLPKQVVDDSYERTSRELSLEKQDAKLTPGATSEVNESNRKGKSIRGKRKGIVKKSASVNKAILVEVVTVDQACQAISEEIREATKKAKESEDAELQNRAGLAISSEQASSSTTRRNLSTAGRGETTSSGHSRSRKAIKRPMNTCHKSTSTSDPVIEDDHTQELLIKSASLEGLMIQKVGITKLILEECPQLQVVTGSACRVLRKVFFKNVPSIRRVSFAQSAKLEEEHLLHEVFKQPSTSHKTVYLRPMHEIDQYRVGRRLFHPDSQNKYSVCLINDYSTKVADIQANKTTVGCWADAFQDMNIHVNNEMKYFGYYNHPDTPEIPLSSRYPWGKEIYDLQGFNAGGSEWGIITDIPWLRALIQNQDSRNLSETSHCKDHLYNPNSNNHLFNVMGALDDIRYDVAEWKEAGRPVMEFCAVVHISHCDITGTVTPDQCI